MTADSFRSNSLKNLTWSDEISANLEFRFISGYVADVNAIVLGLLVGFSTSSLLAVLCHRFCGKGLELVEAGNRALRKARANLDRLAILGSQFQKQWLE
jgi:hypothetical protein